MIQPPQRLSFLNLANRCRGHGQTRHRQVRACCMVSAFLAMSFTIAYVPLHADTEAASPTTGDRATHREPQSESTTLSIATSNEVLRQLVEQGVFIRKQVSVPLPPPTMPDGLDAKAQQALISRIAAPRRTASQLTRRSVVAPFVLKVRKADGAGMPPESKVRHIDLWFIAYGRIDDLADRGFLQQLAGATANPPDDDLPTRWHVLEMDELASRNISPAQSASNDKELYFHSTFPLLDRVLIHATRRGIVTRTDESILLAARLDPRFVGDTDFPNSWQSITLDDLGKPRLGTPVPYVQGGFYVKATRLREPEGALFIEYHQVYEEPRKWFRGANLLRSKLPLIVQDTVRKFRRRLERSQKKPGP